jgi:DNA-binding MarR family transcriptional regulator
MDINCSLLLRLLAVKQVVSDDDARVRAAGTEVGTDAPARLRATIGRLHRRLRPTAAGAQAGLTPTRTSLLHTIDRLGPLRLSELAAEEGINPTMLSRIVADLADGGLIDRLVDPQDKRAALVTTTREGRKLIERMRRERTDVLSVAIGALSDQERRLIERALPALEHLAQNLKGPGR